MSRANVEAVRQPLRVRERSSRTLDQRLGLRFPRLGAASTRLIGRLIGRLPPRSRLRRAALLRGVRLGLEAFNRRDYEAALAAGNYAPDFEYHPPHEAVEAGFFEPRYRGPAGYRTFMSSWADVFGDDFRVEPLELIDLGDRIVLLADTPARAQASGVPLMGKLATVWLLSDGQVVRLQAYSDHAEALAAVGLSESDSLERG